MGEQIKMTNKWIDKWINKRTNQKQKNNKERIKILTDMKSLKYFVLRNKNKLYGTRQYVF